MYNPPISFQYLVQQEMERQIENGILTAVQNVGITVDKEELLRALQYDRNQYDEGYQDAQDSIVRCVECKHLTFVEDGLPLCTLHNIARAYGDYCSDGKRGDIPWL